MRNTQTMPYVIRYKTGETDDLFWSHNDAIEHKDYKQRSVDYIVELNDNLLHFRRCEQNTVWYVYSSCMGDIQGVFLSEKDALEFTTKAGWKVEVDYYFKRLITPYRRHAQLKKWNR